MRSGNRDFEKKKKKKKKKKKVMMMMTTTMTVKPMMLHTKVNMEITIFNVWE
jgi:hypothetical protein